MKLRFPVSLLIVFTLLYTPQNTVNATLTSSIWYVDQNAGGLNNGTSWTNAFNNLQNALGSASSGDQIYVAQGVYTPGVNRSDTFQLVSGVQIYGGFPSGGGPVAQREWEVYETILSGDIGVSGDASDNSYHVVTTNGVIGPPATVLNGFIITGGRADGTGGGGTDRGGGIYNESGYPQLGEILIVDNYALNGGGMGNVSNGDASLIGVTFKRNIAVNFGGGMDNIDSEPSLVEVDFSGNQAGYGGGMRNFYHNGSTWIWMVNVVFVGNTATYDGGAIYNDEANASILNGNIVSNIAGGVGGGIYSTWLSDAYTYNSILWDNQAPSDPQVYTSASSTTTVEYSLVQDGCPNDAVCTPAPLTGDPDFIRDPEDGADSAWGSADDDYGDMRLQMSSPAIDAGDVDAVTGVTTMYTVYLDYADNARRVDVSSIPDSGHGSAPVVDIGAYEHPPEIIYVDQTATGGANSGLSWADALRSLQAALQWGNSGATQVWVAEGAYKPGSNRISAFHLVNNLEIYGGFPAGGGDGNFGARDPDYFQTILSGDIGVQSDSSDNSYHVVDASGVGETAKLDGVAIRYGQGNGDEYRFRYGGGIYNWGGSPTLNDVKIENNYADYGGGMHNREGDPRIQNSMIQENEAMRGAGMHNRVSNYVMSGTYVQDNVASSGEGGGIYNDASDPTISGSYLIGNHAKYGGGMYNEDGSRPEIVTTQFLDNIANSSGGGMYNLESSPIMKYAVFQRNYAQLGGAVYNDDSELTVVNGAFFGNGAKSDCGAILNESNGYLDLVNSVFSGNYGAVVGGICNQTYSMGVLSNVTMSGNYSSSGASSGFGNRDHSSATLVNTIMWGNELGDLANIDADCDATISYSILPSCPSLSTCSNLINADPLFVRTPDPGLDSVWGTTDDDYGDLRLPSSSVGVDAGDNDLVPTDDLDLDGDDDTGEETPLDLNDALRFMDVGLATDTGHGYAPIVDIGAYEAFNYIYLPLVVRH